VAATISGEVSSGGSPSKFAVVGNEAMRWNAMSWASAGEARASAEAQARRRVMSGLPVFWHGVSGPDVAGA
jgi:hypothetical protein